MQMTETKTGCASYVRTHRKWTDDAWPAGISSTPTSASRQSRTIAKMDSCRTATNGRRQALEKCGIGMVASSPSPTTASGAAE